MACPRRSTRDGEGFRKGWCPRGTTSTLQPGSHGDEAAPGETGGAPWPLREGCGRQSRIPRIACGRPPPPAGQALEPAGRPFPRGPMGGPRSAAHRAPGRQDSADPASARSLRNAGPHARCLAPSLARHRPDPIPSGCLPAAKVTREPRHPAPLPPGIPGSRLRMRGHRDVHASAPGACGRSTSGGASSRRPSPPEGPRRRGPGRLRGTPGTLADFRTGESRGWRWAHRATH